MSAALHFNTLPELAEKFRNDLEEQDFILLYAYNGIGKTRLSMAFKDKGKVGGEDNRDTLYFNAFTEDLFYWDNDLPGDSERKLMINSDSNFFNGFRELALEEKIFSYLERYATFDFKINYEDWLITFDKDDQAHIKISRGEETIFKWCIFLAICELVIEEAGSYNWVEYVYIDDPISSLDEHNTIAVACDLATLLKRGQGRIKTVISSHHILFYNVISNELKSQSHRKYFLSKNGAGGYSIRKTNDTPYFHHVASLSELKQVMVSGQVKTYHFNMLRSIMEKTSSFFGYHEFSRCLHGIDDEVLFNRALNLLSHGKYSIYEPVEMSDDNKELFQRVMQGFLDKYEFHLPILLEEPGEVEASNEVVAEIVAGQGRMEIVVPPTAGADADTNQSNDGVGMSSANS
ncbi:MAG: AAA family ATPase [Chitinophagaceae bacterium]